MFRSLLQKSTNSTSIQCKIHCLHTRFYFCYAELYCEVNENACNSNCKRKSQRRRTYVTSWPDKTTPDVRSGQVWSPQRPSPVPPVSVLPCNLHCLVLSSVGSLSQPCQSLPLPLQRPPISQSQLQPAAPACSSCLSCSVRFIRAPFTLSAMSEGKVGQALRGWQ